MKLFGREANGRKKALVVLVAILLTAGGLCGVQYVILLHHQQGLDNLLLIFAITGILELGVMVFSLALIVGVLIAWALARVFPTKGGSSKETTQRTFRVTSESGEQEKPSTNESEGSDEQGTR